MAPSAASIEAVARLEPGYEPLFARLVTVCEADERVRAMWLSGSLARGVADLVSDLDVLVAVRDDDFEGFAAQWREWLATITPTLLARPLPFAPGCFFSLTPERMRLDIVSEPVSRLPATFFRDRLVVFDRDELDRVVPAPARAAGPDPAAIAALVEEFFRDYGMFNVVVERGDWLLGLEAIQLVRTLLYRCFVESNAPAPPSGVKRWSDKLTARQRAVLEALPAATATRESVIETHEAVACAFVTNVRPICDALQISWPQALEDATVRYLRAHDLPALDHC